MQDEASPVQRSGWLEGLTEVMQKMQIEWNPRFLEGRTLGTDVVSCEDALFMEKAYLATQKSVKTLIGKEDGVVCFAPQWASPDAVVFPLATGPEGEWSYVRKRETELSSPMLEMMKQSELANHLLLLEHHQYLDTNEAWKWLPLSEIG